MIPRSRHSVPIWKIAVTLLFIIVLVAVLMPGIKQGRLLWPSLSQCRWGWVGAAAICQTGVYLTTAAIFGAAIRALGGRLSPLTLLFVAMAFLFTTKAFAVAGLATLVLLLARRSIGADIAQAAAGTFYLADYAGFIILALGVYFGTGAVVGSSTGIVASFTLLIAGSVLTIAALRAPRAVTAVVDYVALGGARLLRRPDPHHTASKARSVVESFYSRWDELSKRRRVLVLTTAWALAMHVCETATVACCSRAFGAPVSGGAAAAGYVAGNLAALVSFLPGGVGFFEGAMAAALNHLGHAPLGAALAATLLYRFLALWLPLPIVLGLVREMRAKGHPAAA